MLPYNPLGLEITSTSSCLHFVSMTNSEALAVHGGRILPGDEIVQVNEQVVVGWTHINLVKKLSESASRVSLVLKKVPLSLPGSPLPPSQQVPGALLNAVDLPKSSEYPSSPSSPASSTTADVDSGPDPTTDEDEHSTSLCRQDVGELRPAALSLGMEEAEGKDSLLPLGLEAAALLTVYRCWGGRRVGGQHPTRHPKLTVCPPTLHCRVQPHSSLQGTKCRAPPDHRGGQP